MKFNSTTDTHNWKTEVHFRHFELNLNFFHLNLVLLNSCSVCYLFQHRLFCSRLYSFSFFKFRFSLFKCNFPFSGQSTIAISTNKSRKIRNQRHQMWSSSVLPFSIYSIIVPNMKISLISVLPDERYSSFNSLNSNGQF